jgi:transposase
MWGTLGVRRVLAYGQPMDLRKSITGLVGVVKSLLEEDPLSGSVFVFLNRRGNYLKCVFWGVLRKAVKEMEGGPPQLPIRGKLQTTLCCCIQKVW